VSVCDAPERFALAFSGWLAYNGRSRTAKGFQKELLDPRHLFPAFWALYFLLVAASNLSDVFIAMGWLSAAFPFASGNFALVAQVTSIYGTPAWINGLLFTGILLWQVAIVVLFARAFRNAEWLNLAFGASASLWVMFILADELFIAYHVQGLELTHVALLILQCVTWLLCAHGVLRRNAT
jgi:hypothetical protein